MADDQALLNELLAQEERLQLARFEHEDAFCLGMKLVEHARTNSMPLTIQITRVHQVLFQIAMSGTVLDNDHWVRRKTATVYRFGHSSYYMGVSCRARGVTLAERYGVDPADYAEHGGAFPVRVRGVGLVGAVTVSGLPQEEDHRLVVATLERHLGAS